MGAVVAEPRVRGIEPDAWELGPGWWSGGRLSREVEAREAEARALEAVAGACCRR